MTLNIKQKVEKEMPEFAQIAQAMSEEEIIRRLAELAKTSEEIRQTKASCDALISAKEEVKLLSTPFNDAEKAIRLKIRYFVAILKERVSS